MAAATAAAASELASWEYCCEVNRKIFIREFEHKKGRSLAPCTGRFVFHRGRVHTGDDKSIDNVPAFCAATPARNAFRTT